GYAALRPAHRRRAGREPAAVRPPRRRGGRLAGRGPGARRRCSRAHLSARQLGSEGGRRAAARRARLARPGRLIERGGGPHGPHRTASRSWVAASPGSSNRAGTASSGDDPGVQDQAPQGSLRGSDRLDKPLVTRAAAAAVHPRALQDTRLVGRRQRGPIVADVVAATVAVLGAPALGGAGYRARGFGIMTHLPGSAPSRRSMWK